MSHFDKEDILNILYQSEVKLTSQVYIKKIKKQFCVSLFDAKKIVQQLIQEQELSYHSLYGATYVEKSFLRPVRVSKHFVLTPPGFENQFNPNDIEIIIETGLSFGSGQHPTTQLCLEAIDYCFFETRLVNRRQRPAGADIGTGSGVLAIAMCLSGLALCNAYEIDPVSICEAKRNIALNHLTKKITVIESFIEECKNNFSIICANLRFPTLAALSDIIYASLRQNGIAVLSGVRQWEKEKLLRLYSKKGFETVWQKDEKKWSAFVLVKKIC
ncbi:MAG: 50S ribosomal protein L11 methyltransferase [Proteobacteria bacterium]|nr:50S ribosomal protein L11 methyltransferase [Pseudomonadota bacterium]MBU1582905.1 50S ribosomal protein L11 methyltransferase [Pseudomonadota bacterium]MBU2453607.1 50S ribosomal protein L11 methyltransferase [Pseudomonadota bacterium]MBU2629453.1 50S ribosomal protein L11 methyltransferase [Pseudomonadota bacterium]